MARNAPRTAPRSAVPCSVIFVALALGCGKNAHSESTEGSAAASGAAPRAAEAPAAAPPAPTPASLGVADRGIWSELDDRVQLTLPAGLPSDQVRGHLDAKHQVLVLTAGAWPVKVYSLAERGAPPWTLGGHALAVRPGDRAELAPLLSAERLQPEALSTFGDHDDDGIPDPLDVLLGAKKTVLNADAYSGGYLAIPYPMGDVPRDLGVCTDVIVRAVRNAGVDLQRAVHEDIARARRSYPMVKGNGDANIDHRRVKTLLVYFLRHWEQHTAALDDAADPLRPGDVILMDTFPSRTGPDHIGIVSDHLDATGLPLIINNWTDGTVTAEMDLLTFVPVTHRFRLPSRPGDAGRRGAAPAPAPVPRQR
jgi:uncharacterized protein YijF (DUF1287 family)